MNREEFIGRYGEAGYERMLEQRRQWYEANAGHVAERTHKQSRKGGKYYQRKLKYDHTGLPGERNKVRYQHGHIWRQYKNIIAPGSQLHHQWLPESANYQGVALVEANQHMHGFIDVIQILEGKITLLSEH